MAGVKTRRAGTGGQQRFWYKRGTDDKLTRVLRLDGGKRRFFWGIRDGDWYTEVPPVDCELR